MDEMLQIALLMFKERDYELTSRARWKLKNLLVMNQRNRGENEGNARFARNLVERVIRLQALRLVGCPVLSRKELLTLEESDFSDH